MKKHFKFLVTTILTAFTLCLTSTIMAQEPAQVTVDGLVLVEDSTADIVYLRPDADFSNYDSFMINLAEVRFHKSWERDMRRSASSRLNISERDKERIKKRLSDLLYDTFTEELQENDNFLLVGEPGENVLALNVSVINLYVTAPDITSASRSTTYITNAGSMVLIGELVDSTSGEVLARFADGKSATNEVFGQVSSGPYNRQQARLILRGWAKSLREGMEEIHGLNAE